MWKPNFCSWLWVGLWLIFLSSGGIQAGTTKAWWDRGTNEPPRPKGNEKLTASYFFPYMCSVVYWDQDYASDLRKMATWVSTCTIFSPRWVVASVDNFDYKAPDTKFYLYHDLNKLRINVGTTYGNPSKTAKGLKNLKVMGVDEFVAVKDAKFIIESDKKPELFIVTGGPDGSRNLSNTVRKTRMGIYEWNVAFLKVKTDFQWSTYILPAPQIGTSFSEMRDKVNMFKEEMEMSSSSSNCILGGYDRFSYRLGFYEVKYIPLESCRTMYCTYDSRACLSFPDPKMHVCFKSVGYGSDACPEDRGSALYCDNFGHSIFAILTTAPNCGWKNLPSVYTLVSHVAHAYESVGARIPIKRLPQSELNRYTLPPADLGI